MSGHPTREQMARIMQLGFRLNGGLPVSVTYICGRFKVSKATAQRDLTQLEQLLPVEIKRECSEGKANPEKHLRMRGDK